MNRTTLNEELLTVAEKKSMQIHAGRTVRIFRSKNSKQYGNVSSPYVEFVEFDYSRDDKSRYFIKYPGSDIYIELTCGGSSSSGRNIHLRCRNIVKEALDPMLIHNLVVKNDVEVFISEEDALITDNSISFEFLELYSEFITPERNYDKLSIKGEAFINGMLKSEYVEIPEYRNISYAFFLRKEDNHQYLIVDNSAFKFSYRSMRAWFGTRENLVEVNIDNLARARDGGTTTFSFIHDGTRHEFFSPSKLRKKEIPDTTLDKEPMQPINDILLGKIVTELEIKLEPVYYKD